MLRLFKEMTILFVGALALIYLLNPIPLVEILPDLAPIVGNLDEGVATVILMNIAAYYGIDLTRLLKPPKERARNRQTSPVRED